MYQLSKMKTEQQLHANIKIRSPGGRQLIMDNRTVNWAGKILMGYKKEEAVRFQLYPQTRWKTK